MNEAKKKGMQIDQPSGFGPCPKMVRRSAPSHCVCVTHDQFALQVTDEQVAEIAREAASKGVQLIMLISNINNKNHAGLKKAEHDYGIVTMQVN